MTNISETFFDCISFQRVTANSFAFGIVEDNEDVRKWRRKKAKYEGKKYMRSTNRKPRRHGWKT